MTFAPIRLLPRKRGRVKHEFGTPNVLQFYTELQQRSSVAARLALFKEAVARFGIAAFACGELDLAHRDRYEMFIAEWPEAEVGFINRDPVVNAVAFYRKPFEFGDIIRDSHFSRAEREAVRSVTEFGWNRGLAVPIPRGGTRFGLVSLLGYGCELGEFERRTSA
jgi:Autoinducer binding domain